MSAVAIHNAKEGTEGGKKRRKQHSQGAMTMTNYNMATTGRQAAPVWGMSRLPHIVTSVRYDHLRTTLGDSSRRPSQTMCTLSGTS
jgi:hypothetical protein